MAAVAKLYLIKFVYKIKRIRSTLTPTHTMRVMSPNKYNIWTFNSQIKIAEIYLA